MSVCFADQLGDLAAVDVRAAVLFNKGQICHDGVLRFLSLFVCKMQKAAPSHWIMGESGLNGWVLDGFQVYREVVKELVVSPVSHTSCLIVLTSVSGNTGNSKHHRHNGYSCIILFEQNKSYADKG
jgi:hypothetical protein